MIRRLAIARGQATYEELGALHRQLQNYALSEDQVRAISTLWHKLGMQAPSGPIYRGISLPSPEAEVKFFQDQSFRLKSGEELEEGEDVRSSSLESWTVNADIALRKFTHSANVGFVMRRMNVDPDEFVFAYNGEVYETLKRMDQELDRRSGEEYGVGYHDEFSDFIVEQEVMMLPVGGTYNLCTADIPYVTMSTDGLSYISRNSKKVQKALEEGREDARGMYTTIDPLKEALLPRMDDESREHFEELDAKSFEGFGRDKLMVYTCQGGNLVFQKMVDEWSEMYNA